MPKPETKSITDKIKQLDESVAWFYSDDFSLDEAITKYQAAIELSQEIQRNLTELKNQVEVLADFTK